MKPAKACQRCRASKRKCVLVAPNVACLPCQQRRSTCSISSSAKSLTSKRFQSLACSPITSDPTTPSVVENADNDMTALTFEHIAEYVNLYMRFVHDRPHSLFHEKTLWADIRAGQVPECLVLSICAMGCRFSLNTHSRDLGIELRKKSSSLFSQTLETISLSNIQTCILLANIYAAERINSLEALYFGIANRMAHVLRLHETQASDPPILKEIKCRIYWTLFMADRWCPPGLGLPREIIGSSSSVDLPMDEIAFQNLDIGSLKYHHDPHGGLWKYKITLVDVLGPIQDLNQSLVQSVYRQHEVDEQVAHLAQKLSSWRNTLPEHMIMNDNNLEMYKTNHQGGTFVALHLGYHHYSTLLYFQYLDATSQSTGKRTLYASKCRHHALAYSRLLRSARQKRDCQVVYVTVAHMTMVSSSVLLHMLLFGDDEEVNTARMQLTYNFEALVELRKYWPHMDQITRRLLTFQNACLRSTNNKTYKIDRWMVRFLLEHALPLEEKDTGNDEGTMSNALSPLTPNHEVPAERTDMLNEAFADLCR